MSGENPSPQVRVPPARFARWVANFEARHGVARLGVTAEQLVGEAEDGSGFRARLPFEVAYAGPADVGGFIEAAVPPACWGVLLVRKGGFAVGRLVGHALVASKVGQRHVQGRSKAGGQSQQRFARRRDNQARAAYAAAADHAHTVLGDGAIDVVTGGDRQAVAAVLDDPRLGRLRVVPPWVSPPDSRRAALEAAVESAVSITVEVVNR